MTLPTTKADREMQKFTENINGEVSIRVEATMVQGDATSIQGVTVSNTAPIDQQTLVYDDATSRWVPTTVSQSNTDKVFTSSTISTIALTLKTLVGQLANIFSIKDASDNELMSIDPTGLINVKEVSVSSDFNIARIGASDHGISLYGTSGNREAWFRSDSYNIQMSKAGLTFYTGTSYIRSNGGASAAAPTYSWRADNNTGMYNPSADTVGISSGGTDSMRLGTLVNTSYRPIVLNKIATASLPDPATMEGAILYDSTVKRHKYSNGTNWINDELERGWVEIVDTTYTSGSPKTYAADTRTLFEIHADTTNSDYSPTGDASWWDGVNYIFQPTVLGAYYEIRLNMIIDNFTADRDIKIELDIGGSVGVVYAKNIRLSKVTAAQEESVVIPVYTLSTFIANGGKFYITPSGTSVDIHDVTLVIFKQWNPL